MRLKCRLMDVANGGASWSDQMVVTVEGVDEESEPEKVAELVNQATYELVSGTDEECEADIVRAAGTASHGICWLETHGQGSEDVIIEWHLA